MKVEGWLFLGCGVFFAGADIVYWYESSRPDRHHGAGAGGRAGAADRVLRAVHRPPPAAAPGGRHGGEIVQGTGEIGFFSPHSWWPLWVGLAGAIVAVGFAIGWWLVLIGVLPGASPPSASSSSTTGATSATSRRPTRYGFQRSSERTFPWRRQPELPGCREGDNGLRPAAVGPCSPRPSCASVSGAQGHHSALDASVPRLYWYETVIVKELLPVRCGLPMVMPEPPS